MFRLTVPAALVFSLFLNVAVQAQSVTPAMQARAVQLAEQALVDTLGYELVASLTTEVGPRLAGTEAEARARDWAVERLKGLGFSNVRVEPFELPVWQRGVERAEILAPYPQPLVVTALGGSVSTGPEGVEADIAAYPDVAALQAAPERPGGCSLREIRAQIRAQAGNRRNTTRVRRAHPAR